MTTQPTALELSVLRDVAAGRDPWGSHGGGSRLVSQALGRMKRKGLLQPGYGYVVTEAGRAALAKEDDNG